MNHTQHLRQLINDLHQSILIRKPNMFVSMRIYKLSYIVNNITDIYDQIQYQDEISRDLKELIRLISNDRSVSSDTIQIFSSIVSYAMDHGLLEKNSMDHLTGAFQGLTI